MHRERNEYDCFNNLIEMIVEIREIALFTRATPGSSLVPNIFLVFKLVITSAILCYVVLCFRPPQ